MSKSRFSALPLLLASRSLSTIELMRFTCPCRTLPTPEQATEINWWLEFLWPSRSYPLEQRYDYLHHIR